MKTIKPIKRSIALSPLSRDHHDGLLLCWKIRAGIKKQIDPVRISAYVLHFYEHELAEHFRKEEEHLFVELPDNDTMKIKALEQHNAINTIISQLKTAQPTVETLTTLADKLDEHIRYEERELFNYIEQVTPADKLLKAGDILNVNTNKLLANWTDEFWEKR